MVHLCHAEHHRAGEESVSTLRDKRGLILDGFRAEGRISADAVEAFNNQRKVTTRKADGLRTQASYDTAWNDNFNTDHLLEVKLNPQLA